jgi:endonuclease/exonuclease/phosphatase family metal-dependent hydrolase
LVVDDSYVPPLPKANNTENAIKMMSYNVMGWSACGSRRRRGTTSVGARGAAITDKIKAWDPDVLGAQEVETGNGQDYESCHDVLVGNTNLDSGLYKHSVVEKLEDSWTNLVRGYWMSGARFKHKKSGAYFLFFNSHWKHGYGMEQAKTIANAIDAERQKYGNPPTILLGDTNQFCKGYESSAYKYLTGQEGSSPVKFVDVHEDDRGGSFGSGECRVDFIFASEGQWSLVNAEIDRDGVDWPASDHAALKAVLVPALKQTSLTEYKVYES